MKNLDAIEIANRIKFELLPYCYRCEIAGSVRRRKSEVHDIEIVAIPKDYEVGLFPKGVGLWLAGVDILKGKPGPDCRYLQIRLPDGINLNLFFAKPDTFGYIFLLRSGPSLFSKDFVIKLQQAQLLYNKICEIEKTYPEGHNQIEKIREQKQDLIARFPAIKGERT